MDINILINQMAGLFLVMFLGYLLFKIKLVDDTFSKGLTSLIINVTMPCLLISSVMETTERQPVSNVLLILLVAFALYFVIFPIVGIIIAKMLRVKPNQEGMYMFMTSFSNIGFMGFPIISAVAGPVGLFYATIFNMVFNLGIFTIGIWLVSYGKKEGVKFSPRKLLSPGFLGACFALLVYFLNLELPIFLNTAIDLVGDITSPAAMLVTGFTLAKMDIKNVFNDWRIYVWLAIKQIALPLILWIPFTMLFENETIRYVSLVLAGMPVANMAVLYATTYGSDEELAARSVFITTLFSLITVPLCVWIVM